MPRSGGPVRRVIFHISCHSGAPTSRRTLRAARNDDGYVRRTRRSRMSAQGHFEAALRAGAGHHRLVPALDVGVVGEIDLMALVPPRPAEDREIGDRNVA